MRYPNPGDTQIKTCDSAEEAQALAVTWRGILARLKAARVYDAYLALVPLPRDASGQMGPPVFGVYLRQKPDASPTEVVAAKSRLMAHRLNRVV